MRTVVLLGLLLIAAIALIAVPAPSFAGNVCYTDTYGNFFTFAIKPACHATSSNVAVLTGRVHLAVTCGGPVVPGRHTFALHGTCFGSRASDEVRVGFTVELDSDTCFTTFFEVRGSSTASTLTGAFRNVAGSVGGEVLSPANCATAPLVD